VERDIDPSLIDGIPLPFGSYPVWILPINSYLRPRLRIMMQRNYLGDLPIYVRALLQLPGNKGGRIARASYHAESANDEANSEKGEGSRLRNRDRQKPVAETIRILK
jgi:hypothetical protein